MKILVVEDDTSSRIYLENLLEVNDYECKSAANGIEGLNLFEEYKPDVVLTDIQMPIMDGLELLESLHEIDPGVIVIITTAYGTENYAIQALHLGANNYLKKPVTAYDLLPLLKKYESILENKAEPVGLPGKTLERSLKIEFDTNLFSVNNVPKIVDKILIESDCKAIEDNKVNVELGLAELITNALEHGNLEISYQQKKTALDEHSLEVLYEEKLAIPELKQRKLRVTFCSTPKYFQWVIKDEGAGFDWEKIPDPTSDDTIMELNGRGVFISKFLFDSLEYNDTGNEVIARFNKSTD
ncbi:MAG: response regulator [Bacteroidota bacterium]|nr:response regulator [Bacteroidota bacterium]